ncbi:MAG: lamin tail domain-containing protein [Chloroflexota bacterium]
MNKQYPTLLLASSILFALLLGVWLVTITPVAAHAQSCDLTITEIMYQPTNSTHEWLEVYNPTNAPINLSGYILGNVDDPPSAPIGNIDVPAGGSVILHNSTYTTFSTEWGSSASVSYVSVVGGFDFNDGGDIIGLWTSGANYNLDDPEGDGAGFSPMNACATVGYGTNSPGQSIFRIGFASGTFRKSDDCQGTPRFTSFESSAGDIGSPNENVDGNCHPTIKTSDPYTGNIAISVNLTQIDVTFSEPISIADDVDAVQLLCGGTLINIDTFPLLPATNISDIEIQIKEPLTNGSTATLCTLLFNKASVSDITNSPATFPAAFEFAVKFTTEGATSVELASFQASDQPDGRTLIEWTTAAEIDNAGFHLYGSHSLDGPWTQINSTLIPAQGSPYEETSYSYVDDASPTDTIYYVYLEDIDMGGKSTLHPASLRRLEAGQTENELWRIFIPTVY